MEIPDLPIARATAEPSRIRDMVPCVAWQMVRVPACSSSPPGRRGARTVLELVRIACDMDLVA